MYLSHGVRTGDTVTLLHLLRQCRLDVDLPACLCTVTEMTCTSWHPYRVQINLIWVMQLQGLSVRYIAKNLEVGLLS